jgi:PAS domain S-box-containing protein
MDKMQKIQAKHNGLFKDILNTKAFLALVGCVLITASVFLWKDEESNNLNQLYSQTESTAVSLSGETEARFKSINSALNRLANEGVPGQASTTEEWIFDATFFVNSFNSIKSIAWVDKGFLIRIITPLRDNQVYINKTASELISNPSVVNLWVAAYKGTELEGFVFGTIDTEALISPLVANIKDDYMFRLTNQGTIIANSGNWENPREGFVFDKTITLQNTEVLNLSFAPSAALINSVILDSKTILLFCLSFTLMALIAIFFAQYASIRSKVLKQNKEKLEITNKELEEKRGSLRQFNAQLEQQIASRTAQLQDAHRRLRNIIEGTHVGTWEWNVQTGETVFNGTWAQIVGYTLDGLSPISIKTWEGLVHPDDLKKSGELLNRHFSGELPYYDCECRMRHKDGHWVWVQDRGRVITRTEDGKPLMMFGTHADITGRKWAEAENLQLRDKAEMSSHLAAVGEMAAGIAHEINNPLTGVIGFSELLSERQDLSADVKDQLKIIADGGNRVKDIVKRMLTFARQIKPIRTSANIHELIDSTLEIRSYVLKTANIEVVKYYDPDLPWVTVDPGQMQQVFLNLIVNAEYAMKKAHGKGTLVITTGKKDGHICISFKDDGIGMSQEIKDKIFHPFFTTKQVNEGTGLGLGLSRSIVLEHGGTIEVESEIGQGADFIIKLPITQLAEEAVQKPTLDNHISPENFKPYRILVVDDEEGIRKLVSTILAQNGHIVDATGEAKEALAKLENTHYDAVIMDIRMPGMSGMELYAKIKEKHPELTGRFLFITGDTSDATTRDFLEQNKLPYITKPFDRETLLKKVSGFL